MPCIIGQKREMSQIFKEDGTVVPVTLVYAHPNVVTQVRTESTDGYTALQLGSLPKKNLSKSEVGHTKDLPSMSVLHEFPHETGSFERGQEMNVSLFAVGMHVDVIGTSKGRGFAGVVKRHHFSGGQATHGQKDQMRMPGSIGSQRQGPVMKGKRMGGHMGDAQVTVKNLEVIAVDPEQNILAIKGAIPGPRNSVVFIQSRDAKTVWQR